MNDLDLLKEGQTLLIKDLVDLVKNQTASPAEKALLAKLLSQNKVFVEQTNASALDAMRLAAEKRREAMEARKAELAQMAEAAAQRAKLRVVNGNV